VLSASYKPLFTAPSSAGYKAMAWMVNAYKTGLVAKANLDYEDYQGFETQMAHGLVASVFSDYSGDIGTVYDVASQSSVVGDVTYSATPGISGAAPNLGTPTGSASQGRPNMSKLRSSSSSGWRSPQTKRRSLVPLGRRTS